MRLTICDAWKKRSPTVSTVTPQGMTVRFLVGNGGRGAQALTVLWPVVPHGSGFPDELLQLLELALILVFECMSHRRAKKPDEGFNLATQEANRFDGDREQ